MTQPTFQACTNINILVALGANTTLAGQSLTGAITTALHKLNTPDCRLIQYSRFFSTPCFPAGAGPDYVNAVAACETRLTARELLSHLHAIESDMGRERVQRWGNRTMDLDLLAFGDAVLPDIATFCHWRDLAVAQQRMRAPETLITPHPRMADRAFVLIPLLDIAPDWQHPVSGLTVRQMADALPEVDKTPVIPLAT